ncbi:MAG: hypothetical protein WBN06_11810 [Lysobacterales bacterium]
MSTKLQALVNTNEAVVDYSFEQGLSDNAYEVVTTLSGEKALKAVNDSEMRVPPGKSSLAKAIMMFIAAPFIALAYIVALPFIGFYQFAKLAFEAYSKKHPVTSGKLAKMLLFAKNVGLFLISPFIALGYVFALPCVGFYMFTKLMLEVQAKRQLNT